MSVGIQIQGLQRLNVFSYENINVDPRLRAHFDVYKEQFHQAVGA